MKLNKALHFFVGCLLGVATTVEAQVYRWTDASGQQHFSDRPPQQAEDAISPSAAELVPPERYSAPPVGWEPTPVPRQPAQPRQDAGANPYERIVLLEPANEATIWSAPGEVAVTLELTPALREGDRVQVYLDGKVHSSGAATSLLLSNVDRGTHSIALAVQDASGRELIRSASHTFYLHRPSRR